VLEGLLTSARRNAHCFRPHYLYWWSAVK